MWQDLIFSMYNAQLRLEILLGILICLFGPLMMKINFE